MQAALTHNEVFNAESAYLTTCYLRTDAVLESKPPDAIEVKLHIFNAEMYEIAYLPTCDLENAKGQAP